VDDLIETLNEHALAWGVTADTPDMDVINETRMARDCARAAAAIKRLRRELEKSEEWLQRVQRALAFWHPGVRVDDVSEEMTERAANDAMLIFGLEDADEQSAIELGWIHWVIPGENGRLRRELAEAQRDAARYRWLRNIATAGDWVEIGATDAETTDAAIDAAIASTPAPSEPDR
jgi:hypothetical protein